MTDGRSDLGDELAVIDTTPDGEATLDESGTWAAIALVVVAALVVAAAVVPAVVSGPTNPYAAAGLVVLGLGAMAGACAIETYGLVRRSAPAPAATLAALAASIPAILPLFRPGGGDLTFVFLWMVLLAVVTLLVRRSQAAWVLLAVTALPALGLFALSLGD